MKLSSFEFAIQNTKQYIRSEKNRYNVEHGNPEAVNVFDAAHLLAIAFMKDADDVLSLLITDR